MAKAMKLPVSIIIPTFNEELFLPTLLSSLQRQSVSPKEIIVADAFSMDNTRAIAKNFGCKIVDGGLPAKARNNGAEKATQPILLFLDADVKLPPRFLEQTIEEMNRKNLDITSCFVSPKSSLKLDKILHSFANNYMRFTQKFHPHIPGCCIFIRKDLHQKISGFDESVILAEDHDYVRRAKKFGKFSYLRCYKIPISVRRLSKEGRVKIALKYLAIELHLILLGRIRKKIFNYDFGYSKPNGELQAF